MYIHCLALLIGLTAVTSEAVARERVAVQAVQVGSETVRYLKGRPTLDLERDRGVVQLSPFAVDHSSLIFTLAMYNDGAGPINFGLENLRAEVNGKPWKVLTVDELISREESRANWKKFGLALFGGLAAAGAATEQRTYRSTTYGPYGTYRTYARWNNPYAAQNAALIAGATAYGIDQIQQQLDETTEALGDNIIQLTTVDPGDSYAGKIVLEKFNLSRLPTRIRIIATMNGEDYPLEFQIAKPGTPAPAFTAITPLHRKRQFRAAPGGTSGEISTLPTTSRQPGQIANVGSGMIAIRGGYKIPAKTKSGYCLQVAPDYVGSGALSSPAITDAMPRCNSDN